MASCTHALLQIEVGADFFELSLCSAGKEPHDELVIRAREIHFGPVAGGEHHCFGDAMLSKPPEEPPSAVGSQTCAASKIERSGAVAEADHPKWAMTGCDAHMLAVECTASLSASLE